MDEIEGEQPKTREVDLAGSKEKGLRKMLNNSDHRVQKKMEKPGFESGTETNPLLHQF